jgi:hypothetical protein
LGRVGYGGWLVGGLLLIWGVFTLGFTVTHVVEALIREEPSALLPFALLGGSSGWLIFHGPFVAAGAIVYLTAVWWLGSRASRPVILLLSLLIGAPLWLISGIDIIQMAVPAAAFPLFVGAICPLPHESTFGAPVTKRGPMLRTAIVLSAGGLLLLLSLLTVVTLVL